LKDDQPASAVDYFRQALALEPRNAKTHYLLAKALDLTGNREEALAEAARAVELGPDQPEFKALQDQLSGNGK
jgi:Flp pilus assembly protein TadD